MLIFCDLKLRIYKTPTFDRVSRSCHTISSKGALESNMKLFKLNAGNYGLNNQ